MRDVPCDGFLAMAMGRTRRVATGVGSVLALILASSFAAEATAADPKAAPSRPTARISSSSHGARAMDAVARRAIAGGPTADDAAAGVESTELKALRDAERELFPPASPAPGSSWPSDLPLVFPGDPRGPARYAATGLPPSGPLSDLAPSDGTKDLAWVARLELPDIPVRWDERVLKYLEFFRDDPRGRSTFANLYRHSGRWRDAMRRALRRRSLPEDLVYVAMVESGFDTSAHSTAGAAGLWQFMPETAKIYGLSIDRWVDQRMSPTLATEAAADFLGDLHRRFGSWELAFAGYNMGYAGLAAILKRYNTNDYWSLARTEGTLPWETTLYVPKIVAVAVVAHNLAAFGLGDLAVDPAIEADEVNVPPGTPLSLVAQAAGSTAADIESYNPELRSARIPPASESDAPYPVKVPPGKAAAVSEGLAKMHRDVPSLERYVVRFGETLDQIASAHGTTQQKLVDINAIAPGEALRGGTVLLVPRTDAAHSSAPAGAPALAPAAAPKQAVVVPADLFVYPDRKRVFYRVLAGDTLRDVATALHVSVDDLRRWNAVDAAARLQQGMTLQAFVPQNADLAGVATVSEGDVRVLPVGSEEFFASLEHDRGFKRIIVLARAGDTLESIGKHYDVPVRTMERINRKGRGEGIKVGDPVVVYAPTSAGAGVPSIVAALGAPVAQPETGRDPSTHPGADPPTHSTADPAPSGPLPLAPLPDLLPP
jgi:membrane-bound lytic murein transglycosylase D